MVLLSLIIPSVFIKTNLSWMFMLNKVSEHIPVEPSPSPFPNLQLCRRLLLMGVCHRTKSVCLLPGLRTLSLTSNQTVLTSAIGNLTQSSTIPFASEMRTSLISTSSCCRASATRSTPVAFEWCGMVNNLTVCSVVSLAAAR